MKSILKGKLTPLFLSFSVFVYAPLVEASTFSPSRKELTRTEKGFLTSHVYILKKGTYDWETDGEVSALQRFLTRKGFPLGKIDGMFGPKTEKALEAFKRVYGIRSSAEGVFDPRDFASGLSWDPKHLFLGSDEIFFYRIPDLRKKERVVCNGKEQEVFGGKGEKFIMLTFPYGKQKEFSCSVERYGKGERFLTVHKKENKKVRSYARIRVPKRYTNVKKNTKIQKRIQREKEMLKKLYRTHENDPIRFSKPFILPLDTEMISPFGKTRIINGKVSSYHSGVDFRAREPLPVRAVNDGVVLFTGNLYYCGNAIIVNHGGDLFTAYCHLSEIDVEEGERVERGEIVGKTGATGRVSGPHLHLSTKFQGKYMDFMKVYEYSKVLGK